MKPILNRWKNEPNAEGFYDELDAKKSRSSCCTCQTLSILFIFFLVFFIGGSFYLYWQITRGGLWQSVNNQTASVADFNQKLENPAVVDNQVVLILTADEFNAALNNGLTVRNFILKDIKLSINPKEFLIYGNLIQPLKSKIVLTCVPQTKNGRIKLNVRQTSAGNLHLPAFLNQKIADSLNSVLDQKMAPFYEKYVVTAVNLDQNKIIIKGKTK